jgi:hypothetical protein
MKRKICWPKFDAVCLAGGCIDCERSGQWKTYSELATWCARNRRIQNGNGHEVSSIAAFHAGRHSGRWL